MKAFEINKPDEAILEGIQNKIDNLTKPKGSLGVVEEMAKQVAWVQQTLSPSLNHPCHIVFAADHGIVDAGVSPSPKEITWQQAINFSNGGGGINVFTRQHGFKLYIVDSGVDFDFDPQLPIIHRKIRKGTRNFLHEAAMTEEEMNHAIEIGAQMVDQCHQEGCQIISFGELGIGNTSPSSVWMNQLTGVDLELCVGAGSGWASESMRRKCKVLQDAVANYQGDASPKDIMRYFGGYEMVMAVGGMLRAAELGMVILVDGFIMTNCILMAERLYPNTIHYAIFGHQGEETGHKLLLDYMGVNALLQVQFRLGEGTGAICAFPIVDSGVRMINEMQSFQTVDVTPITKC